VAHSEKPVRRLAAIMFTDIAGFTKLSSKDGTKAAELLTTQRELLKPIVESHGGNWLEESGDGLLLTFRSATDALECAVEIQEKTREVENLCLRIGIHQGEIIERTGGIAGADVNIASRIEAFAAVGGIAISDKVQRDISSNPHFTTKSVGKPRLKGVSQKIEIFCITSHGLPHTKRSEVSAKLEKKAYWPYYVIAAVFVAAVLLFHLLPKEKEVPSIGILMMSNLGMEEDEYWTRGITEDLIIKVAGAGRIRVAPMHEILGIDTTNSIVEIAKQLRVNYILTSSLQKKTDGFDLRCQLIEANSGISLYADKWSERLENSPKIVGTVANSILEVFDVSTKQDIRKAPTANTEAYEMYFRGKYTYETRDDVGDAEVARGFLNRAIELDDNLLKAKSMLGLTYQETGDYETAMSIYEAVLVQAEELDDKSGIGNSLNSIGIIQHEKGKYNEALDYYTRAFEIHKEIGDKREMAALLSNIGVVYSLKGDLGKALDHYQRALKIQTDLGDKHGMGNSLNNIGIIHGQTGDLETSLDYYLRSLEISEELEDKQRMAQSIGNIGIVYTMRGDLEKALEYTARSLEIQTELSDKRGMGYSLGSIGNIYLDRGDYDEAINYYTRSLEIQEKHGDKRAIGFLHNNIGVVHWNTGNYEKAAEHLEQSLAIQNEIGLGGESLLETTTYLLLAYKNMGRTYDSKEIQRLIDDADNVEFKLNYRLYNLLDDRSYLETAYYQLEETTHKLDPALREKYLTYPLPKSIIADWESI
jgi:tetratricopeptide (TPR) repeat protein/class 3 adenylate cyclase